VLAGRRSIEEEPGRFDHHVGADLAPLELGGVLDRGQADLLAIDDEGIAVDGDRALEASMHRIVLQHVGEVIGLEKIVDADDFDVGEIPHRGAKYHASDAPESVDANFDGHAISPK